MSACNISTHFPFFPSQISSGWAIKCRIPLIHFFFPRGAKNVHSEVYNPAPPDDYMLLINVCYRNWMLLKKVSSSRKHVKADKFQLPSSLKVRA